MFTLIITIVLQQKEMPIPAPNLSKDLSYTTINRHGASISLKVQRIQMNDKKWRGAQNHNQQHHRQQLPSQHPLTRTKYSRMVENPCAGRLCLIVDKDHPSTSDGQQLTYASMLQIFAFSLLAEIFS